MPGIIRISRVAGLDPSIGLELGSGFSMVFIFDGNSVTQMSATDSELPSTISTIGFFCMVDYVLI